MKKAFQNSNSNTFDLWEKYSSILNQCLESQNGLKNNDEVYAQYIYQYLHQFFEDVIIELRLEPENRPIRYSKKRHKSITIGTYEFNSGSIDVSDPGYARSVWCRHTAHPIKPGKYVGAVLVNQKHGGHMALAICHEDFACDNIFELDYENWEFEIGSDSGLVGFFQNKPDFSKNEWKAYCDNYFNTSNKGIIDCGIWAHTFDGDGSFDVFSKRDKDNQIVAMMIVLVNTEEHDYLF